MGKYQFTQEQKRKKRSTVHPVWRGIGLIWLILLPIMAYAAAILFTRANFTNHWLPMTPLLNSPITLPGIVVGKYFFNLQLLIDWFPPANEPLYYADLLFFGAFLFLGFGVTSILYAFLYRVLGPPKDPYEVIHVMKPRKRRIG